MSGFECGLESILALGTRVIRECDDQDAVGGCHTHCHDRSHESRHAERRLRKKEYPHDTGEGSRKRHQDDEGVRPGLEIESHQQVDEKDRRDNAQPQVQKRRVHRLHLPAQLNPCGWGQMLRSIVDDFLYIARHPAQIALFGVCVYIHHRRSVEMGDRER